MRTLIIVTIVLFYFAASTEDEFGSVEQLKKEMENYNETARIYYDPIYVVQKDNERIFDSHFFDDIEQPTYGKVEGRNEQNTGLLIAPIGRSIYNNFERVELTFEEFQTKNLKRFKIDENAPTKWEVETYLKKNVGKGYEVEVYVEEEKKYYTAVITSFGWPGVNVFSIPEKGKEEYIDYTWAYMVTHYRMRKPKEKMVVKEKEFSEDMEVAKEKDLTKDMEIESGLFQREVEKKENKKSKNQYFHITSIVRIFIIIAIYAILFYVIKKNEEDRENDEDGENNDEAIDHIV